SGGALEPLLAALKGRQNRQTELAALVNQREAIDIRRFDRATIEKAVRERAQRWRELLTKSIDDGRRVLREVLTGPLRFTPEGRTYRFEGEASVGRLLAGVAGLPTVLASPTGFEPVFWP